MTKAIRFGCRSLLFAYTILNAQSLQAGFLTFTDRASFEAALPTPSATLNFDSLAAGTLIAEGETVQGITFDYDLFTNFGVSLQVLGDFDTTSPLNYLGTDDGGVFLDGDSFDLGFTPSFAIGLYVISADEQGVSIRDGDVELSVGGETVGISLADGELLSDDVSWAYFLGIVSDDTPFTTASLGPGPDAGEGFFFFNIDDITTAPAAATVVPEPASLLLFGIGAAGLTLGGVRRRKGAAGAATTGG